MSENGMKVVAIAAVAANGVIGNDLELPWNIPEDMRFFRQSTKGQVVVMGRRTFDALKKPLPHRENVVITRDPSWRADGVRVFHDLGVAIRTLGKDPAHTGKILFVIGGAQIYRESFPWLDEIWLTEIQQNARGNVVFPDFAGGKLQRREFEPAESRPQSEASPGGETYFFVKYRRKPAAAK